MAYTTQQAIETLNGYLSINETDKEYIDDTKKRGFILELSSGERIVIFVYPLVHKQDNTKNYFDIYFFIPFLICPYTFFLF